MVFFSFSTTFRNFNPSFCDFGEIRKYSWPGKTDRDICSEALNGKTFQIKQKYALGKLLGTKFLKPKLFHLWTDRNVSKFSSGNWCLGLMSSHSSFFFLHGYARSCNYHVWINFFPTSLYPRREKTIWSELETNPGPLASQATALTTRPFIPDEKWLTLLIKIIFGSCNTQQAIIRY